MTYEATIYSPPNYWPAAAFQEVADTVNCALKALGKHGKVEAGARAIIFGAHLLPNGYKSDAILYNLEQRGSEPLERLATLSLYRRHETWDYSASNVVWLREHGVDARLVPIGYVPELTRIPVIHPKHQDIDVLFYGALNPRRDKIISDLRQSGLNVYAGSRVYGAERDALISRAKIIVNIHYYDARTFEIVRCSYLYANKMCVISEESTDVPTELVGHISLVPYADLVSACVELVNDEKGQRVIAEEAFEAFVRCHETEYLARVLP